MKIAILASLLRPVSSATAGGTEVFTSLLTEKLVEAGQEVTLFATSDSQTNARLSSVCSSSQTTGIFEGSVAGNLTFELLQAKNAVERSNEFDLFHNNYWAFYTFATFAGFTDRPVVTTIHNNFWQSPNAKESLIQTHQRGKDIVVFLSEQAQAKAEGKVDSVVIPNGIDTTLFPYSPTSDDYILWFSRMDPKKGIKEAIDAARSGNFKLILAGSPPNKPQNISYIDEQVRPYFSDSIQYVGPPSTEQKLHLYQHAKALLLPVLMEEQFGLVLVEAMSSGTPVIVYNRGAVAEVVKDGETGFIVDPDDEPRPGKGTWIIKKQGIEGLQEAVARIGEIDRAACRSHVENNFSLELMVSRYTSLYERVVSR